MKTIIFFVLFLALRNEAFAISYTLTDEWYRDKHSTHLTSTMKGIDEFKPSPKGMLFKSINAGYRIENDKVYRYSNNKNQAIVGELIQCDGLKNTCLNIDGFLKFKLPNSLNFHNQQAWHWNEYTYNAVVSKQYSILGQELDVLSIGAACKTCIFKLVTIDLDKKRGITRIKFEAAEFMFIYALSSPIGLFNNIEELK